MEMRRCLLVLDMDLLALDEQLDLEPINYLMTRQEQEPCEVVVLSLAGSRQARLPALELLLGARVGKFPVAPKAGPRPRRRGRASHEPGRAAPHDDRLPGQRPDQR
jgi:hypothetical protein